MIKVLLSVPNGRGWVHKHVVFAICNLLSDKRVETTLMLPTHKPYINNLHLIQKDFLNGIWDYWITMDDDNPPRNNVIDLVLLGKDIIGCPTPVWHNSVKGDFPVYWNAVNWVGDGFKPHLKMVGLQRVDAVGSGCMVISRKVMEKMKAPFMREWNEDGTVEYGGDFAFCMRAKEAGFEVYAHFDYPCMHFNEIEIGEVVMAFNND